MYNTKINLLFPYKLRVKQVGIFLNLVKIHQKFLLYMKLLTFSNYTQNNGFSQGTIVIIKKNQNINKLTYKKFDIRGPDHEKL